MSTTTTHHTKAERSNGPTPRQLRYLRNLAERTGTTFVPPATVREASAEITRLKALVTTGKSFAELDVENRTAEKLEHTVRDTAQVRDFEISGYGSTATWSERS